MGRQLFQTKISKITTPKEKINISGYVKYPMKLLELSNSNITNNEPYILQNLDINKISNILNKDVYPFYINLESGSDYGFQYLVERMRINTSLIICMQVNGFYSPLLVLFF